MAVRWNRLETWLGLMVLAVGGVLLLIGGLWIYMSATAEPIHADPTAVPSSTLSESASQWADAIEQSRQAARAHVSEKNLPGLSVAVGIHGDIVWAEGFGYADLDQRVAVTPETRFRIGTASITLTSAAAGLLFESGMLGLDDEIQKYVPDFPPKRWPVTVRHLMGHVAGLVTDGGDEGPLYGQHCEQPSEAIDTFGTRDLRFEPGTGFRFTSYGWVLISAAIEQAAGEPFLMYMQKRVFEPLHMDDTMAEAAEAVEHRAVSYFPRFAADPRYGPDLMRDVDLSCYAGAAAFLSTPSDLVRFASAVDRGALLRPETVRLLQTPLKLLSGQDTGYGLGWDLEDVPINGRPTRMAGHDGDLLGGMVSSLMTFPDRGLVVAVTSNTSYSDSAALAAAIAQAFSQQKSHPR